MIADGKTMASPGWSRSQGRGRVNELLTPEEMGRADRAAIAGGVPGIDLMEAAGRAVADVVLERYPQSRRIAVLAGPGNNGGDGFVAARYLAEAGWTVAVFLVGDRAALRGDAAIAADRWSGPTLAATVEALHGHDVIVDALFGAGLARPIEGAAADLVEAVNGSGSAVVAVDRPSGVNGETGRAAGAVIRADATVTFFRRKPGHLLLPGRLLCGDVSVHDIGIPDAVLADIGPRCFANGPALWRDAWHPPALDAHKYARGHAVVVSGPMAATGAARLAAMAALRAGAGLVTVASPPDALLVNACHLTAVMVRSFEAASGLQALLGDRRLNAVAIGPGTGVSAATAELVTTCLDGERAVVLDADALTACRDRPELLFDRIRAHAGRGVVLTPHDGEFARLFPDLAEAAAGDRSKLRRARAAAERSGATIVLKGPDTVIAAPDGRAAINDNAPPWLATAGSGDVLTGLVAGLLAQGLPGFEAAAMAVWLHGAAASQFGLGMIAEDLERLIPVVLQNIID